MDRPDVDAVRNIRPAIALEQKNPVRKSRSTVGTTTEVYDYMRLLFARAGTVLCPKCSTPAVAEGPQASAERLISQYAGKKAELCFSIDVQGKDIEAVQSELLKNGIIRLKANGVIYNLEYERPDDIKPGAVAIVDRVILREVDRARITDSLEAAYRHGGGSALVNIHEQETVRTERLFSSLACPECGSLVERPDPIALSFNHPVGACPECKGFGNILKYDPKKVIPDEALSLSQGAVEPWTKPSYTWWFKKLEKHAHKHGISMDKPFSKLSQKERTLVFEGTKDFDGIEGFFNSLETKRYKLHIKVFSSRYKSSSCCPSCRGARLKNTSLNVTLNGLNIAEALSMTIKKALEFFSGLELAPIEKDISREVLRQINSKLEFLNQTGLGYITLDRLTKTLSGGEAQRVAIAAQLAASLTGVLYILDEPSAGLHPGDVDTLISQLKNLSSRGNTVVVVEHDSSIIKESDYIVEIGPGAGEGGGRAVFTGTTQEFFSAGRTITADYLSGRQALLTPRWRRTGSKARLKLKGAAGNNLKDIDVNIPLNTMTCVTGVSGSGKSSLVIDTLYNTLAQRLGQAAEAPLPCASLEGAENIAGVKLVDQSPVGRTPRSNPITYIGAFDEIRRSFARLAPARAAGLSPGSFSFNVPGGRCESCKGEGVVQLEMYFLPDVYIKCAHCNGRRYRPNVLDVRYRGKNINDCLNMTFSEASNLFSGEDRLKKTFSIMKEVGLGYLKLGQSALTLSGGEAQRLKIARELMSGEVRDMLYIFDEPTTGLHPDDIRKLLSVLGRLVDSGATVLVIEHNLDCIKTADHVIDLGPGHGDSGGRVTASGTPEDVARSKESVTARYLKKALLV